ncbi:MAG: ATP-dependent helicase [Anaerolineales bacterium]|nr:MAG: ATP-dependent helicase [Anaerolineales bacterium]
MVRLLNHFTVGSLVKARGREWVVLPESEENLLVLRPLGGTDDEITGIYLPLEKVEPATFNLPDPFQVGDYRSARLLRDAVRLGFRSSAGPFRSFGRLAFDPRPYQLVPLLMALKLDPVRLLIADDVGIGKTIEAGLVARELLDRGEIERLAVLCPPALAEQWQGELRDKFHIEAELVLPSTAPKLERNLMGLDQTIFDLYPYVVISTEFIKTEKRRDDFKRTCPELVIVDEAHTCAFGQEKGRHLRYELITKLAENPKRHILLVTATPHSGKENAFRSLLTFLDEDFASLPEDLTGSENERYRKRLAGYFIQRQRADIRHYMDAETHFPDREEGESSYKLSPEYKRLFERVLEYVRESVQDLSGGLFHQRVRWWSALALLRSLASSPMAASATLRNRAATVDAETTAEADEIGRRTILDMVEDESAEGIDVAPGGDPGGEEDEAQRNRKRLLEMARIANTLAGDKDEKLKKAVEMVTDLLMDGFRPILFCRFIPTADYVAAELRQRLPKDVDVVSVTGVLPPSEREERILQLAESPKRVLVCTDCLSEGINLQDNFDAVLHYDLSWNPTRHEQREGRVDRYGQKKKIVRVLTYYGTDNQIDGVVLDVLLRKHKTIRSSLGISIPVPGNTEEVIEAIFEGLLLRSGPNVFQGYLPGFDEFIKPKKEDLYGKWEADSEREKRSRTLFAQETIKVEEVTQELHAAQAAVGSGVDVAAFTKDAFRALGAAVSGNGTMKVDLKETPQGLRDILNRDRKQMEVFEARFESPFEEGQLYLTRTHPLVEGLSSYVMESALDPLAGDRQIKIPARRCGAIRTAQVDRRTTLTLVRFRYHIVTIQGEQEKPLLAEDCQAIAFTGSPQNAEWLDTIASETLLSYLPDANINSEQAGDFVKKVVEGFDAIRPHLDEVAVQRGKELLEAHQRVRRASKIRNVTYRVEPQLPPDVIGIYVYLPMGK